VQKSGPDNIHMCGASGPDSAGGVWTPLNLPSSPISNSVQFCLVFFSQCNSVVFYPVLFEGEEGCFLLFIVFF